MEKVRVNTYMLKRLSDVMLRFRNTIEDENLHQWLTTGIQNYRNTTISLDGAAHGFSFVFKCNQCLESLNVISVESVASKVSYFEL